MLSSPSGLTGAALSAGLRSGDTNLSGSSDIGARTVGARARMGMEQAVTNDSAGLNSFPRLCVSIFEIAALRPAFKGH